MYLLGDVQDFHFFLSSLHLNVEPGSLELKTNFALWLKVIFFGPLVMVVSGGVVSDGPGTATVNVRLAGVGSALPAASVATTANVCAPLASGAVVTGDEHGEYAAPSTLHWKVDPASLEVNANVAVGVVIVDPSAGPEVIVVSGGVASTVNVRVAGVGSGLPAGSVATTEKVWAPSDNGPIESGERHGAEAPPSMEHANVDPASVEPNSKVAVETVTVDPSAGPAVIVVSGGVESATQVLILRSSRNQP